MCILAVVTAATAVALVVEAATCILVMTEMLAAGVETD